jgi:hypothetical protein
MGMTVCHGDVFVANHFLGILQVSSLQNQVGALSVATIMKMKDTDLCVLKAIPPGFIEGFERSAIDCGEYIIRFNLGDSFPFFPTKMVTP